MAPENVVVLAAPATPPASATDPVVGRYTLEIVSTARSGLRCQQIPDFRRQRTYTADVEPFQSYYAVKLYDAAFLRDGSLIRYGCTDTRLNTGGVCHQFILLKIGDDDVTVDMTPLDEDRGSEVWEVLPEEGRLLALHGQGAGTIRNGRIEVTGTGGVWYGNGLPASDYSACDAGEMAWVFTRRGAN